MAAARGGVGIGVMTGVILTWKRCHLSTRPCEAKTLGGVSFETWVAVSVPLPRGCEELLSVSSVSLPCSGVDLRWHPPLPCWEVHWRPHSGGNLQSTAEFPGPQPGCTCWRTARDPKSISGLPVTTSFYHHSQPEPPNSCWVVSETASHANSVKKKKKKCLCS